MNKLRASFLALVVAFSTSASLCVPTPAHAAILNAPFQPEVDKRFNALETGYHGDGFVGVTAGSITQSMLQPSTGNLSGLFGQVYAKAVMTLTGDVAGTYNTPIVLPANSIIGQAWIFIDTAITPSGTTIAFQCDTANDIFTATDETGASAGAIVAGVETGTAGTMHYSSAGCTVKMVTAVHTALGGKVDLFLDVYQAK